VREEQKEKEYERKREKGKERNKKVRYVAKRKIMGLRRKKRWRERGREIVKVRI
jgi:hypothetical protein